MRFAILGTMTTMLSASIVLAADPPAAPAPTFPAPLPHPVAAPAAPPAPVCESCTTPASSSDKSHHLLKAAEHLEAAGMSCEAKALREQAKQARSELLKEKRAELERLQAEIAALEQASPAAKQILLKVKAAEVSLTNLRALGFDLTRLGGLGDLNAILNPGDDQKRESVSFGVVDRKSISGLLDALVKEDIAKILAEPKLVTVDRRPASYFIGGEIRTVVPRAGASPEQQVRKVGTELDFLPVLLKDGNLRCEIRVRVSQLDPSLNTNVDGNIVPGVRMVEIDTGLEIRPGQTVALAGLTQQRTTMRIDKETHEAKPVVNLVETLFLVTPELVEPPITATSPHAPAPR